MSNKEIETERYRAECAEKRAKEALRHYLHEAGAPTSGDCAGEIEGIVEDIVTAATARAVARTLEDRLDAEVAMTNELLRGQRDRLRKLIMRLLTRGGHMTARGIEEIYSDVLQPDDMGPHAKDPA